MSATEAMILLIEDASKISNIPNGIAAVRALVKAAGLMIPDSEIEKVADAIERSFRL